MISDSSRCPARYLLTVQGPQSALNAFEQAVRGNDTPFQLSQALPPPEDLREVDPVAVAFYHVLAARYDAAVAILDELQLLPELLEALRGRAGIAEVGRIMREGSEQSALAKVPDVRHNLTAHNALTKQQWLRRVWGKLSGKLEQVEFSASPGGLEYMFRARDADLTFLEELAPLHPALKFRAVVINSLTDKQSVCEINGEGEYSFAESAVDPFEEDDPFRRFRLAAQAS